MLQSVTMKIHRLPPDQWQRLPTLDLPYPKPEQGIVVVAEHEDKIIGQVGAERCWLVSPFSVDLEWRGNGVAEELGRALIPHNTEGLTEVLITNSRHVELLVYRLGFQPLKGRLWRRLNPTFTQGIF